MKQVSNFHGHTFRCGHGKGTEREMLEAAFKSGLKVVGFSEHVPVDYNQRYEDVATKLLGKAKAREHMVDLVVDATNGIRMPYGMLPQHVEAVLELKKEYPGQVYLGFECEYIEAYIPYYRALLESGVDYLILGNHFDQLLLHDHYYGFLSDDVSLMNYAKDAIKAFETGLFKYFAHPDLFMRHRDTFGEVGEVVAHQLCQAALKHNVVFELNLGGFRMGKKQYGDGSIRYPYNDERFWKIVASYKVPCCIGVDAHQPDDFLNPAIEIALEMAKRLDLNLILDLTIDQVRNGVKL